MTREEHEKLKLLCSKQRLESANRYLMSDSEKEELKNLRIEYDELNDNMGKAIFYMHDFLGIDFDEIAKILNYTYNSVRARYYDTKILIVFD